IKQDEHLVEPGNVMSLWGHLDELRTRIVRAGTALLVCFAIALGFSAKIVNFLKVPLEDSLPAGQGALHFTGPMDVFMVNIKVAFLISVVFGVPVWLYQFWKFVEPALYPKERKFVLPFIVATIGCFLTGVAFCYYFMLPLALHYLIGIGLEVGTPMITITDYISLITVMILGFGLVFETPVILVLLAMLNLVTAEALAAQRRLTFIVILIISAVITPPDPISMIGMAIPCYLMYELSIVIIRLLKKRRKPDEVKST
ncbi:MAG: twin-arginine translocase subunit TatC, partial [Proteobacteria bacterium]|nr:twin-arginine translocase subunit TatC [Pseudomonadota bacterium]